MLVREQASASERGHRLSRRGVIDLSGKFNITDGDKPGEGEVIGVIQAFDTGMLQIKIDGYLSTVAAEHARIQWMAAINASRGRTP